jgi:hypothetical protein
VQAAKGIYSSKWYCLFVSSKPRRQTAAYATKSATVKLANLYRYTSGVHTSEKTPARGMRTMHQASIMTQKPCAIFRASCVRNTGMTSGVADNKGMETGTSD